MKFISTLKKLRAECGSDESRYVIYAADRITSLIGVATPLDADRLYGAWLFTPDCSQPRLSITELLEITCILSQIKTYHLKQKLGNDYIED